MPLFAVAFIIGAAAPLTVSSPLYEDCIRAAEAGTPGAIDAANRWLAEANGGIPARHCLGIALLNRGRPAAASATFEDAARIAEATGNPATADLYGQAGNAALLAGDSPRAELMLNAAIVAATDQPALRGSLMIDRAQIAIAAAKFDAARGDLDAAKQLSPLDSGGWLLSAALARREERLTDAANDIARALALAPNDVDIMLEAGNIAAMGGEVEKARHLWQRIQKTAPDSIAGKAASDALLRNPAD